MTLQEAKKFITKELEEAQKTLDEVKEEEIKWRVEREKREHIVSIRKSQLILLNLIDDESKNKIKIKI